MAVARGVLLEVKLEFEADFEYLVLGPCLAQQLERADDGRPLARDLAGLVRALHETRVAAYPRSFACVVHLSAEVDGLERRLAVAVERRVLCAILRAPDWGGLLAELSSQLEQARAGDWDLG